MDPRQGARLQGRDARPHDRDAVHHRVALCRDSQGLLPDRGHRLHPRRHRGADRRVVPGHGGTPARDRRDRQERSGGRLPQFDRGRGRPQPDQQLRAHVHFAQAESGGPRPFHRGHPAAAQGGERRARHQRVLSKRPEHQPDRPYHQERVSVHDPVERHRGALPPRAGAAGENRAGPRAVGCQHRPLCHQPADVGRHRPRTGRRLRHQRRPDPPGTLQRLRRPTGRHHLHADQRLSGHPGEHEGVSGRPVRTLAAVRQGDERPDRAARCGGAARAERGPAAGQPPGRAAGGDHLVQPGAGLFARLRGRRDP